MAAPMWRKALLGAALAIAILEIVDAFFIEFPLGAVVFAVLLLLGALWLRRPGRAPVIFMGVLCLIELVFVIVVFRFTGPTTPPLPVEVAIAILLGVASAIGLVAAVGALRSPRLGNPPL